MFSNIQYIYVAEWMISKAKIKKKKKKSIYTEHILSYERKIFISLCNATRELRW